jgi:hypothetical protein
MNHHTTPPATMDRKQIIIDMQAKKIKDLHAEIAALQARIQALTAKPRKAAVAALRRHASSVAALHRLMAECSVAPILLAATRMRVTREGARSIIKKQPEYKLVLINRRSYVARR